MPKNIHSSIPKLSDLPRSSLDILESLGPAMSRLEDMLVQYSQTFEPGVADCIRYVITNQGKRLRPALAIFSANAKNGKPIGEITDEILKACAIVELVHIATLVHDDIMDGAELRRNRLTAGAKWGHEISVLVGDALFAQALALSASYPTPWICRRVAETANILCSGEIMQTQRRFDLKLTMDDYFKIVAMKTGALFALSCELGSHLAGATPKQSTQFYEFGRLLGVAYQIYDDCIDLVGSEKDIGKSLGTDLQKGKLTLPIILLLQRAKQDELNLISSLLLNEHTNSRGLLLEFIKKYDTLNQSVQQARQTLSDAEKQLEEFGSNAGRLSLQNISCYLETQLLNLGTPS